MVQPKYNPKEALERAKLLMNYDSHKTLTENIDLIEARRGRSGTANPASGTSGTANPASGTSGTANPASGTSGTGRRNPRPKKLPPVQQAAKWTGEKIKQFCQSVGKLGAKQVFKTPGPISIKVACAIVSGILFTAGQGGLEGLSIDENVTAKLQACDTPDAKKVTPKLTTNDYGDLVQKIKEAFHPYTFGGSFTKKMDTTDLGKLGLKNTWDRLTGGGPSGGAFQILLKSGTASLKDFCSVRELYSDFDDELTSELNYYEKDEFLGMLNDRIKTDAPNLAKGLGIKIIEGATETTTPTAWWDSHPCIKKGVGNYIQTGDFSDSDGKYVKFKNKKTGLWDYNLYSDNKVKKTNTMMSKKWFCDGDKLSFA